MLSLLKRFVKEEEGAAMVEYAIIIGIIAVGVIILVGSIGNWVNLRFTRVEGELTSQNP